MSGRLSLSKTISSPRRGVTVNPSWPAMRWTSSECSPAALMIQRAVSAPCVESIRQCPPFSRRRSVTRVKRRSSAPASTAWVAQASGGVHGQMMYSSGTSRAPSAPGPRCGSRRYSSSTPTGAVR